MSIKASYKYQLRDNINPIIVFYIVIVLVYLVGLAFVTLTLDGASMNGLELASMVFLFVLGLCSFKENFLMLVQNGISRKTVLASRLASFATVAVGMSVIDMCLLSVARLVTPLFETQISNSTMLEFMYPGLWGNNAVVRFLAGITFNMVAYFTFLVIGYFITMLFYRLNKTGKVLVGAGVPVLLAIVIPTLDYMFTGGKVETFICTQLGRAFGLAGGTVWQGVLCFLVLAAVASGLCWLMLRRAAIKK